MPPSQLLLQNRFDAAGLGRRYELDANNVVHRVRAGRKTPDAVIHAYKDELAEYLGRVRGPGDSPLNFKLLPRPRAKRPKSWCRI